MVSLKRRSSPSGPTSQVKVTITKDHGTITNATVAVATMTVTGVKTTDILVGCNSVQKTGLGLANYYVSAANEVTISLFNCTAGSLTSGTVTYMLDIAPYSI